MRLRRQGKSVFWSASLLAACLAISLVAPSLAGAESSSFYSSFSKCPTGAPEMNDPATEEAACFSNIVRRGVAKVGNLAVPFTSPMHLQFAVAGLEGEEGVVKVVPGSTSLDAAPLLIPNLFATPPAQPKPPVPPVPPKQKTHHKKKHHKKKHHKKNHKHRKGQGSKGKSGHRLLASAQAEPMIAITMEPVGDLRNFNLLVAASETAGSGTAFELPVRMHLEGENLGPNCYIGSLSDPIVIAAQQVYPGSSLIFGHDPNGFPIQLIGSAGSKFVDPTLAVPGATHCGPPISATSGLFDAKLNGLAGLPAPAGASAIVLGDNLLEFVGAGYDGTAPDGGAELQAAFDAAK